MENAAYSAVTDSAQRVLPMGNCTGGPALSCVGGPTDVIVEPAAALPWHPVLAAVPRHAGDRPLHVSSRFVNQFLADVQNRGLDVRVPLFHAYCRYLGIDPEREPDLLWIAELAAIAPMPMGWTLHEDTHSRLFYHHSEQQMSRWTHPLEEEHRAIHQRITTLRNHTSLSRGFGLARLRCEMWQLEAECAEAEYSWVEHRDNEGHTFFFNRRERLSSWTDPRPAMRHRLLLRQRSVWCFFGLAESQEVHTPNFELEPDRPSWLEKCEKDGLGKELMQHSGLLSIENAAECPVCYEPLCTSRPSALISADGRRICGHYFCLACARRLQFGCPVCRAQSSAGSRCIAVPLPNIEKKPLQWFCMADVDGDRCLQQTEVVKALQAVLPLDADVLRRALESSPHGGDCDSDDPHGGNVLELDRHSGASAIDGDAAIVPGPQNGRILDTYKGDVGEEFIGEVRPPVATCLTDKSLPKEPRTLTPSRDGACPRHHGPAIGLWDQRESSHGTAVGSGISLQAFFAKGGMLQWIVAHVREFQRKIDSKVKQHFDRDRFKKWFDLLCDDAGGGLTEANLLRALDACQFSVEECPRLSEIRDSIHKFFEIRGQKGGAPVSRDEFLSELGELGWLLLGVPLASHTKDDEPSQVTPTDLISDREPLCDARNPGIRGA
eukprot:TRINITY_DN30149_c0_g1_i1.p1 TRINITY_DN30149_c0_g1~~TRINITY_DN30149_c0_g1_i1.p1  ORF type:complete len:664 (-),score=87.64 TRINITY_DN30149_c0_g1_i1:566-2557(-)